MQRKGSETSGKKITTRSWLGGWRPVECSLTREIPIITSWPIYYHIMVYSVKFGLEGNEDGCDCPDLLPHRARARPTGRPLPPPLDGRISDGR